MDELRLLVGGQRWLSHLGRFRRCSKGSFELASKSIGLLARP